MQAQSGAHFNQSIPQHQPQHYTPHQPPPPPPQQPQAPPYTGYQRQPYQGQPRAGYGGESRGYTRERRFLPLLSHSNCITSSNPIINGSVVYTRDIGFLYLNYGEIGYISKDSACPNPELLSWEKAWLREVLYTVLLSRPNIYNQPSAAQINQALQHASAPAPTANSILFGTTKIRRPEVHYIEVLPAEATILDAMAGEGSRPNKRLAATIKDDKVETTVRPGILLNPVIPLITTKAKAKTKTKRRAKAEPKAPLLL